MKTLDDYIVIQANSIQDLQEQVNQNLLLGYELRGELKVLQYTCGRLYMQVIVHKKV